VGLFCDVEVMRHVDGAMTPEAADALFAGILDGSRQRVFQAWLAEDAHGVVVGHAALLREGEEIELGYVLPRAAWGQGYATEMARRVLNYALDELGRDRVIATVDEGHSGSIRVLDKIGMVALRREVDEGVAYWVYCAER